MRIQILGLNYAPEEIGIGPYSAGLAEALAAAGHAVSVVAGQPYYPKWARYPGYSRLWQRTVEQSVRITRCPHYIPVKPSGAKRLIHHFSFAASALFPMLAGAIRRPDLVLVVAPSLLSVPIAWLAAKLSGAKLWIHVQDFEVEAAMAMALIDSHSAVARMAPRFERMMLRAADRVSTISPQMCDRLRDKGVVPGRIYLLRNWANHAAPPQGITGASYRREWSLGGRKVVLYSGNIANKQGLDVVIEAARLLRTRDDLVFVICGEGPNRDNLELLADGMQNVQFRDLQSAERVRELLALAHCHLLPQRSGAADLVLPSKMTNMLASGRPVVATANPGTGIANEVQGCGIVVTPEVPSELASAIAQLADDPALAKALGDAARLRAVERWSLDGVIRSLLMELERLKHQSQSESL